MSANRLPTLIAVLIGSALGRAGAMPPIEHWTTPEGTQVYLVQTPSQPTLDLKIDFDAGEDRAPVKEIGTATFAASELLDYSFTIDSNEMRTPFEKLRGAGAHFNVSVTTDRASLYLSALSSQKEVAIGILGKQLTDAAFPHLNHDWRRKAWVTQLEANYGKRNQGSTASMARLLYGSHPYANADLIGADTVDDIGSRDVLHFQRRYYRAAGMVVSMVGNIDRPGAERVVRQLIEHLPKSDAPPELPPLPLPAAKPGQLKLIKDDGAAQSHIQLGQLLPPRSDPDYPALALGNYILGGGEFESRLMNELRVKRGLVYGVDSSLTELRLGTEWNVDARTRREQTDEVLALMKDTISKFVADGPTEEEMTLAKDYYRHRIPFWTDSNKATLEWLSRLGYHNLPVSYLDDYPKVLEQLTAADVKAAWQRWLKPTQLATVIVGGQPKVDAPATPDASKKAETAAATSDTAKPESTKP
ncbi:M16 family metallopeptidase [Andreprevotia chitinilytica]|uniref:M16 family metallopeptidase n=1 Tax=Andreprevotia chitinilytica TaxID=396808 RepID=UPI000558B274|nr:pitrilysin family protein [Andreprevotia chitinilytica]